MQEGKVETPESNKAPESGSIYNAKGLATELAGVAARIADTLSPMAQLEASGEQLAETFGYAGSRVIEMETQINKSATSILGLSKNAMTYEAAMKRAGDIVKEVSIVTNRNVVASSDVIKSLELTAEATGVVTKELAQNFTDAGFQLTDVSKQMETAANVAQRLGVNVGAVTKGVSDNLKNLNIYNFQGGVEGLAKMVAKSAVLGVGMEKVFSLAEKAFDPEQAIELASRMQSLGVATSDLLDPLKIMDLGQNNPDELMNQMVNVTKGLTKIDEASGKVSILPGEQGRLRELAGAMGMLPGELSKMAIKAGELEFKMKKIAFPKMTEENKEMIANLSSFGKDMKGNEGFVVTVKNKDGEEEQKLVSELNPDDVEFLKKQAIPKTLEQIADDQLTVSQKMLKTMEFIASAPRGGLARGEKGQAFRREMDSTTKDIRTSALKKDGKGEDFHDQMATTMNGMADELLSKLPKSLFDKITKALPKPGEDFDPDQLKTDLEAVFKDTGVELKNAVMKGIAPSFTDLVTRIGKDVVLGKANREIGAGGLVTNTTTPPTTTPTPSLNWHETLDASMEEYKNSMNSQTITTPTEKTPEQIKEDENKKQTEIIEEMITAALQPKETPGLNMSPVIDNGIAQTDRLIQRVDLLIDAVKESKFVIDYDKLKLQEKGDENYTSIFEPIVNKLNEFVLAQEKIIGFKPPEPTISENKEIKTNEIIKENNFVEVKPETPKTTEFNFTPLKDIFVSNNEKLTNSVSELKNGLNIEPTILENKEIKTNEIIKEKEFVENKPEISKMPEFDVNSIVSTMSNQTDKFVDNINSLKETTKENKMDIDYDKFASKTSSNDEFASLIQPMIDKFGGTLTSVENKVSGIKNFEPTIVENKQIEQKEIIKEKEILEIKPEITKMPEFDTNSIVSTMSNQTDKFVDNINSLKETTKENKTDIDYDKFASKTSSNEDFTTLITPLIGKFSDAFTSVDNKVSGIKNFEPTIVENKETKTNEIIKEKEFVENKTEIPKMPEFDTSSIASAISNQTDKFSDNLNSLKETTKENKMDINYDKFISNTTPDENYSTLIQPMIDKFGDAFTSVENKVSGVKNFEPTVVEKQELKELKIEQEPLKIESAKETPMITPEKNMAGVTIDGLQKITESKLPESAVRNNAEIAPLTMKTENTTNVGGEITVVVDVRGVQNDASRLIIDEVTKKINSGEFTSALIGQIKNKESAYGQLSGGQSVIPPGFGGG